MIINPQSAYEIREVEMMIEVAQKLGMNTDGGAINFGANFPGNQNKRFLEVSFPEKTKVEITLEGEMASWVELSVNNFVLEPDEIETVTFTAKIPEDADEGVYSGKAVLSFKKV